MARTRIKICGIRTQAAALAAADAGADAIGLVFVPGSPRQISVEEAQSILETLPAMVEPVALFANESPDKILAIARQLNLRTVQLHGQESAEEVRAIAPLRVIKAVAFDAASYVQTLTHWRSSTANVAAMLVDSPPPATSVITGGHGQVFDWNALAKVQTHQLPIDALHLMLAGGLTPENVAQAIHTVRPFAVDVSSGVESRKGVKDIDRIHAFCHAVHAADAK